MTLRINTEDVPVADRPDYLRDVAATAWVPMRFRSIHHYRGDVRADDLGPIRMAVLDLAPITVQRTVEDINHADPDLVKLLLLCEGGRAVVEQRDREVRLGPGEFACYDVRRPYRIRCDGDPHRPVRMLTLLFPPSSMPLTPRWREQLSLVRFRAGVGIGDLTAQFLLHLARHADRLTPHESARVSSAALEMLAARLSAEVTGPDVAAPRHARLTTVQGYILRHLGDPGLDPAAVAAAHHVSVRSLQQLFHDHGLTVAGWIRERRLAGCRRDLADPALIHRPVAAIAARWGFPDPAAFSRTFRSVHGLPPGEYRRSAHSANPPTL